MSNQASVHSIEALKDFRAAMALFSEDALGALGAVDMELRRTIQWLQHDRPMYWQDQIKRRREKVAMAQAEVFRRKLAKTADYTPAFSEQKEILRKAEASLQDAEMRATLVKKWEPALQHAIFEYHGSIRRIKDLASADVPRAVHLLGRMIDALEAYLSVAPPSGAGTAPPLESITGPIFDSEEANAAAVPAPDAPESSSETPEPPEPPA
jgi:hypothetical protein